MMSWRPPDRPWTEPTGIRCVERLKAELLTAEAGLTEVTLLERQLKNGAGKMDDFTRYMLYKAHQAVRDRCAGNEDIARDRVRRIEWIIAGNVASEIRDREEELWRLNRERARVIGKDYMTWYVRGLDENVRSVEREITELKECGEARSIAQKDKRSFDYYVFKRHLDALSEVYEQFEHPAIRDRELFKAVERICFEIERDQYLTPAEKRRQLEATRERYNALTGRKANQYTEWGNAEV